MHAHAPSNAIRIPDAHFLFNADFKRSGVDLVLSADDRELVLHDYFKGEKHAALASPDGAFLTGAIVTALTGAVEVSQADGNIAAAHQVIGHVTRLAGSATAMRNGVAVILNLGDNVEKGDVIQSGADSTVGIKFIDGTVFGLSSNARMVLNDMVYDPNGSNNSSLLSLVAGTITFVAGETAKHGDMKVDTPVATMGIRGTAVLVEIDFSVPGQNSAPNASFQVLVEPDGHTGSYILFDKTTLQPIAMVNVAGQQINITNGVVTQTNSPLPPDVQKLINEVFQQKFSENSNPKSTSPQNDTITPQLIGPIIKLANGATAIPVFELAGSSGSSGSSGSGGPGLFLLRVDGPPTLATLDLSGRPATNFFVNDVAGRDSTGGLVNFTDVNAGDTPTVKITFQSAAFHGHSANPLSAQQLADIAATEVQIAVTPNPGNNNNGSAAWTYSVPDKAFDFLAAGETLTLTYLVTVNNNFAPNPEAASVPITITVTGGAAAAEVWVHTATDGNDNLWTTGQNWETRHVPGATDDVIIITDQMNSSAPSYPVTIAQGTAAVAHSVTMNDFGALPPELDIENGGSLAVGAALNLSADSIFVNSGDVSVGGAAEIRDESVLHNSGSLTLAAGGDFKGEAGITNTGTIKLAGGTLNVLVDIANAGEDAPGLIMVDSSATLAVNGGRIDGGALAVAGTLDLEGAAVLQNGSLADSGRVAVSGSGNTLTGETVTNDCAIDITGALTLASGTTIVNGEAGTVTVEGTGSLTLKDTSAISGGSLTNFGNITIEASTSTTLDGVEVDNASGTIHVDPGASAKLILDDGTTISGGALTIGSFGTLEAFGSTGGTLSGVLVNNGNLIQIDSDSRLVLEDAEVAGGTLANSGTLRSTGASSITGATLTNSGTLDVGSGTLALDGTIISGGDIANDGTIKVDPWKTLNLNGVALNGGAISNAGTIEIAAVASIENDNFVNLGGLLLLDAYQTLTLDGMTISGGQFANNGTVELDSGSTLTLANLAWTGGAIASRGVIEIAGSGSIDHASFGNSQLAIDAGQTLTLDGTTLSSGMVANSGTIQVDELNSLDLSHVALSGGTISNQGVIEIVGSSSINDGHIVNSGATLIVDSDQVLTLDDTTITGGRIAAHGSIDVDAGHSLTLDGVMVCGGDTFTNDGIVDSSGSTGIVGFDSILNNERIEVQSGTLFVGEKISGTGHLVIDGGATLELASGVCSGETVNFAASTGQLKLDDPGAFKGVIAGFAGDGTLSGSDQIDLTNFNSDGFRECYNPETHTLFVTDGIHCASLNFLGNYVQDNFSFTSDGNGGTIIYDPPVSGNGTVVGAAPAASGSVDGFAFNFANAGQIPSMEVSATHDILPLPDAHLNPAVPADPDHGPSAASVPSVLESQTPTDWHHLFTALAHHTDFHV